MIYRKPRILVVVDEYRVRVPLITLFSRDFDLIAATNGSQAQRQFIRHGPALVAIVIGDLLAAELNGRLSVDTAPALVSRFRRTFPLPIIGLANTEAGREQLRRAGCAPVCGVPSLPRTLQQVLQA
ncbi:MAG: hypothetical protein AAB619_04370 [Patescibacteria group bacterium]